MSENIENKELNIEAESSATDEDAQFTRENEYEEFKQALEDVNAEYLTEESETRESEQPEREEEPALTDERSEPEKSEDNGDEQKEENLEPSNDEITQKGEDQEVQEQYKEYKVNKICSKINYDLTSPEIVTSKLKAQIADGLKYNFNCFMVLTSKMKALKQHFKGNAPLGCVIGLGESTLLARRWEIRQAKWKKAKEIEVIVPLSLIKEGKKRALIKEISNYKKTAGKKVLFKVAIDGALLTPSEYSLAIECAISAKVKRIALLNFDKVNSAYLLNLAKQCIGKCEIELDAKIDSLEKFSEFTDRGVDYFLLKNAVAVAETVKLD